jgi:hypothetical protein
MEEETLKIDISEEVEAKATFGQAPEELPDIEDPSDALICDSCQ